MAITLRLTHLGTVTSSLLLSDVEDATDGTASYRKAGPVYVPVSSTVSLALTGSVLLSYRSGTIKSFIDTGKLSADFEFDDEFMSAVRGRAVRTVTTATTLLATDGTLLVDTTAGDVRISLPAAANVESGAKFSVKKISADANWVYLDAQTGETIDTLTTLAFDTPLASRTFFSDGDSSWWVS